MLFRTEIINIILLLVAVINTMLGIMIYARNRSAAVNRIYFINIAMIVWWIAGMILYRSVETDFIYWTKFLYIASTCVASTFLYFSYYFPKAPGPVSAWITTAIFSVNALIILLIINGEYIIKNIVLENGRIAAIIFGPYYWFFSLYIIGFMGTGLGRLLLKMRVSNDALERRQISYLLFGYMIAANLAIITNLIMPWAGYFLFFSIGQIFTLFMVVPVTYAILSYNLFNIKVIAAEVLVTSIIIALSIELFFSQSLTEAALRSGLLLLVMVFGYFLIESVYQEIRSKEKIENLANALEAANIELKRLDRAKSEFISIASHQLRTPLTIIKGYLSMIREESFGKVSAGLSSTVNKMYLSNERLIKLVNDLLDLSRMESGRMKYEFAEMDLEEVIDSTVDEFQLPAKDKGIKLVWKNNQKEYPKIWGDAWKLRQVVFNLIDNALKYTSSGHIEIKLEKEDDGLTLTVRDEGIGMTSETLGAIFQKFVRGREGEVAKVNAVGVGLGLFIAKRIVDDHNGKIWVKSEGEGKGSMFFVKLPLASFRKKNTQLVEFINTT